MLLMRCLPVLETRGIFERFPENLYPGFGGADLMQWERNNNQNTEEAEWLLGILPSYGWHRGVTYVRNR